MIGTDRHAMAFVGAGTLGSVLIELLVREALDQVAPWGQRLFIIDPQLVAPHNIAKSAIYRRADVGRPKAEVVAQWVRQTNPALTVVPLAVPVEDVGMGPFVHTSVTFACVDTLSGKSAASRQALRGEPALVMLGELAGGGRLDSRYRWFMPGASAACLECSWSTEYHHLERAFPCAPQQRRRGPPTLLSVAARTAASMLDEARQLLTSKSTDRARSLEVRIAPAERRYRIFRPRYNPACAFDHLVIERASIVQLPFEAEEMTLGDAFAHAKARNPHATTLQLGHSVALAFACARGHEWPYLQRVLDAAPPCPVCDAPSSPSEITYQLPAERAARHSSVSLAQVVTPAEVLVFESETAALDTPPSRVCLGLAPPQAWAPVASCVPLGEGA